LYQLLYKGYAGPNCWGYSKIVETPQAQHTQLVCFSDRYNIRGRNTTIQKKCTYTCLLCGGGETRQPGFQISSNKKELFEVDM
jgi:hypothetical protein